MTIYTIYKITIAGECYVGSTNQTLIRRIDRHYSSCHNQNLKDYNYKVYKFIRENGGWDSCVFSTIGTYECDTETDAHIIEEMWRIECEATLNSKRAYQSKEERAQYVTDKNRRESVKRKAQPVINCPCGGFYKQYWETRHFQTQLHIAYLETL